MKRFLTAKFTALLLAAVLLVGCSAPAWAFSIKQQWVRVSAVAGETLATGDVVALKDADGLAWKADADDAALRPAVGIVGNGGAAGATVEIIVVGRVTGWTALSEGALAYLSGTAGGATQAAPAWAQPLGVALSTTDIYVNFSNYFDSSALTAMGVLSQPLVFEGATANDFETTLTVTDPTADRTVTLPDASGVPILASAVPDGAGAVSGAANSLIFEGATANNFETTVTATDPTADRTVTLPDAGGTVDLAAAGTHDYAGAAVDWTMTAAEAQASYLAVTNANGAVNAILPAATAGKIRVVSNGSGQTLTLKVTGQAGATLATGKLGIYTDNGTDVVEIYEQP